MALIVADFPFASNLFFERPFFHQWSYFFPHLAFPVMQAAMYWRSLSKPAKSAFFQWHPNLEVRPFGFQNDLKEGGPG
jgi:hypothetical protein